MTKQDILCILRQDSAERDQLIKALEKLEDARMTGLRGQELRDAPAKVIVHADGLGAVIFEADDKGLRMSALGRSYRIAPREL